MYVTRPLSLYRKNPSALSVHPPGDAPYTGILVVKDEESEEQDTYCWGACERKNIRCFPFPQNKILSIYHAPPESVVGDSSSGYMYGGGGGAGGRIMSTKVWFLPVLNQPLSSNLYYVIRAKGRYKGKACVSAKGTDICSCCFGIITNDLKPRPLDFRDPYQQFEIRRHHAGGFFAKSAAYDGIPPSFFRRKGWQIRISRSVRAQLDDVLGISADDDGAGCVRATLPPPRPGLEPPVERRRQSAVVVGRWYCPYVFVKEEAKIRRHMEKSMLYRISLEQYWEEIFSKDNNEERSESGNGVIRVNVSVEREEALIYGVESVAVEQGSEVWFRARDGSAAAAAGKLKLSTAVVEGMKAVEVERGWSDAAAEGDRMDVRVEREEEVGREREWRRFGCFVLAESFFFRRMDGVLIIKYTFRHIHKIRCKWE
ncbi:hypothetical protein V2J09_014455 [Rumex salicifolius]